VFLPRPFHADKPAMVVELKRDKDAAGAIAQIRRKEYPAALKDHLGGGASGAGASGGLLLVGVSYDKDTRKHACIIE
ncbi:MAG: hypothetical protein LBT74_10770, partial [Acidobacteriota bacterium]|jgi:hypothetical protein|nr:hypothetical protein [Acidobacteriota bacterium]